MWDTFNHILSVLDAAAFPLGTVSISALDVLRFTVFGLIIIWVGWRLDKAGINMIRRQKRFDARTKEVLSKVYQVLIFSIVAIILLQLLGINLTTLAVFGGAVGVGLGLGLQSIASNFISGIIILIDKSITVGDYVELDDGNKGFVREFRMRYTVLETYDGKDIVVPNERFISCIFINWSHKDPKQRYRVDFSVSYDTDIHTLVDNIKLAVGAHKQVLNGEGVPLEERPDCEIESFGDNGINMFVEFWMEGIDDGRNRVGGDLMLIILDTLRENNIDIPFPQRDVRVVRMN